MGRKLHFPRDGAKVGVLRVDDQRAQWARIQIDEGDARGLVDVTRGYTKDGVTHIVLAADDVEGWIAYVDAGTGLISPPVVGHVVITFAPSTPVIQANCSHVFRDTAFCVKCGWEPPAATSGTVQ